MKSLKIWTYGVITFTWSWANWFYGLHYLAGGLTDEAVNHFVTYFFIGVYGPAIGSIVTTLCFDGFSGIITLFKRLFFFRASLRVYGLIVLSPLVLLASGVLLYKLFAGPVGSIDWHAAAMIPGLLWVSLPAGPLGEELGWRGLLL